MGPAELRAGPFFVWIASIRIPRRARREGKITKHVVSAGTARSRTPNTALNI